MIELTVNEFTNEIMGGLASTGPDRLTTAGIRGIPQVVVPGSADFINFLGPDQYVNDLNFAQAVFQEFEMIQKNK